MIFTYILFTLICYLSTSYAIKKLLLPLDIFHHKIKNINENNLEIRINIKKKKDEIDLLAYEFNLMLERLTESYQKQKEFTSQASHELRTPIARIISQLENKINDNLVDQKMKLFIKKILSDVSGLSELINTLLLLTKSENLIHHKKEQHRIDELIYNSIQKTLKLYPDFRIHFDINIENIDILDSIMYIHGNQALLEVAFINLLKNACLYSDNNQAIIIICEQENNLKLTISNNGKTLTTNEQKKLFEPFMRANNSKGKSGFGLGLRIVQKILTKHNATITYSAIKNISNEFNIIFKSLL